MWGLWGGTSFLVKKMLCRSINIGEEDDQEWCCVCRAG
jgi:hypothetical protein